jgi:hypothetical protein
MGEADEFMSDVDFEIVGDDYDLEGEVSEDFFGVEDLYDEELEYKDYQYDNERYIVEEYKKRYGISNDDMSSLSPVELKQKVRSKKLDTLI